MEWHELTDLQKLERIQAILIDRATGGDPDEYDYRKIRQYFMNDISVSQILPSFVKAYRELGQFWHFIKKKFRTYAERRTFISDSFRPAFDMLEGTNSAPHDQAVADRLSNF